MLKKYLTIAFLAFSVSQVASAASVTYYSGPFDYFGGFDEQGSTGTAPTTVTGLQQFNPSLGTLTGVEFVVTNGEVSWDATLASNEQFDEFTAEFQADLLYDDGTSFAVQTTIIDTIGVSCDFISNGGCAGSNGNIYDYATDGFDIARALNEFNINDIVGLGYVNNLSLDMALWNVTPPLNGTVNGTMEIFNATVQVTYDYSVVPVPAAVWLFGSGLLGLVGIARRKRSVM